ncbi:zinc finger protein swm-like [Drosophila obscura]|uniref:zinc finger protein swm-like n=1 Tax=Drosophila obscura TaxID=7282 RepID=UPI000BA04F24|nr:zinc finger protein swm-like [Drosophila obscura]
MELEPLSDADSSALARYVIVLLNKHKSDEDIKDIMIHKMYVFIQAQTASFVEHLFHTIATKKY